MLQLLIPVSYPIPTLVRNMYTFYMRKKIQITGLSYKGPYQLLLFINNLVQNLVSKYITFGCDP